MQVRNAFTAVRTVIDDNAEPLGQLQSGGKLSGGEEQMTEQGFVARLGEAEPHDPSLGDDENVHRSLRIDVVNRDALVVLVLDPGRDFAGDDAFEEGRRGHDGTFSS